MLKMRATYIVNDPKVAKVLIDPMRRAILDLLRQKPMTQAKLANELGLSGASLNHHMKILRSKKLVVVAKREFELHRLRQIFFLPAAHLFVYDLDSLPKDLGRYFFPISMERARTVISFLIMNDRIDTDQSPEISNAFSERLSRELVRVSRAYQNRQVDYGSDRIVYEIYTKVISQLLDTNKDLLLVHNAPISAHRK
jgi:DNA-binding transcriptional ArsR family regulator